MPSVEGLVVIDEVHSDLFDESLVKLSFVKVSPMLELDDFVFLHLNVGQEGFLLMALLSYQLEEDCPHLSDESTCLIRRIALTVLEESGGCVQSRCYESAWRVGQEVSALHGHLHKELCHLR